MQQQAYAFRQSNFVRLSFGLDGSTDQWEDLDAATEAQAEIAYRLRKTDEFVVKPGKQAHMYRKYFLKNTNFYANPYYYFVTSINEHMT